MHTATADPASTAPPRASSKILVPIRLTVPVVVPMLMLFGGAGRLNWPAAWVYMALLLSGGAAAGYVFAKLQPGLAGERARWREGRRWDRPFLLIIGVVGPMLTQLVCGLDKRFGWSMNVPAMAQALAVIAFALGVAFTAWAMAVNPFFSACIRIQTDRDHSVVARGPYGYVRHPGYVGMVAATLSGPVVLGTLWGLVPATLLTGVVAARTALEDRTLRVELAGYSEYAERVKYRLVPGVW